MIADIARGHVDGADICLLVALILFAVAGVYRVVHRAFDGGLVAFGLALVALAWLIL